MGKLVAELAGPWVAGQEAHLRERRGHDRQRAAGAGPDHQLVFTDRVVATLVILRFQLPHAALALLHGVDRSTITRAVHEIRPLLAARGFAVPGSPIKKAAAVAAMVGGLGLGLAGGGVASANGGHDGPAIGNLQLVTCEQEFDAGLAFAPVVTVTGGAEQDIGNFCPVTGSVD